MKPSRTLCLPALIIGGLSSALRAQEGGLSDEELNRLMAPSESVAPSRGDSKMGPAAVADTWVMPAEPVLRDLFLAMQKDSKTDFGAKEWMNRLVHKDYRGATHVWSAIQGNFSPANIPLATGAHYFALWKQGFHQLVIHLWTSSLEDSAFKSSTASKLLVDTIGNDIRLWMWNNDILEKKAERLREVLPTEFWARMDSRNPAKAESVMKSVSVSPALRYDATLTYAHSLSLQGRGRDALTALAEVEPALKEEFRNSLRREEYELARARLFYQEGDLRNAIKTWTSIPRKSSQYPVAVEERAWALARFGNFDRVRGEVESLLMPIYKEYFGPEAFVLKSITELKLCQFANVKDSLNDFSNKYQPIAVQIEAALAKKAGVPEPPVKVERVQGLYTALRNNDTEINKLSELQVGSINAPLSAVGRQSHWGVYLADARALKEVGQQQLDTAYTETWRGMKSMLLETARKLQFVRVELLNQLAVPEIAEKDPSKLKVKLVARNSNSDVQAYSFDGVVFPDELFRLRSLENSFCKAKGSK